MAQNQEHINRTSITSDNVNWNLAGSNVSLNNQRQSSSRLDTINNNTSATNLDNERLKAFLPGYRLAPDYETAISIQRRHRHQNELHHVQQQSRVASDPHINLYATTSHPDVRRATAITDAIFGQQLQPVPDVTRNINSVHRQQFDPNVSLSQQMQLMRINKYAPPYRFSSTSTPDLAFGSHGGLSHQPYVSGSSPDLLSTRMFANSMQQPSISSNTFRCRYPQNHIPHGSCDKCIFPDYQTKATILPQQIQKPYDGTYRVSNMQQGFVGSYNQLSGSRGSIEPIYENPVTGRERARASSIQSTTGTVNFKQQHPRQPVHTARTQLNTPVILPNSQSLESIYRPARTTSVSPVDHQRHVQFETLNRAQSVNVLDSSTMESGVSSSDHNNSKEKKRRRWKFWGNKGKSSSSEKSKSESSGWYKNKSNKYSPTKEEEINSRHRWSSGQPRLPLPPTMSKENLCQILETKLADPQLYIEFERIPKRKANANYSCALLDENRISNADPNFLPQDDNRVRLTPTLENRSGYYNASYVTATVGPKQRFYIAAQSPHAAPALSIFVQCVWEADVYLLVQLSDEVHYVPSTCDKCLEYGQYQIWKEFSEVTDRCITSKLRIYHTVARRYRSVWHLNYCEWGEQNCPKNFSHFLGFLEELRSVRLASNNEVPPGHNTNPPVMIHCSDGSGRTGVTLLADLLLYTLDHNQDLDMPRVLSLLREQRDNIVPSLAQYRWLYTLLISYLRRTRLI
ncbi:hypothetical protein HA402_009549 [Bradysia odoriphaga]|nr:hypothetical protein HA402_009549 [Bradysia odoriphaga]